MNYYPPANKDYTLPPGEKPPLLVKIHGGPTGSASTLLSLGYQYWTSRGKKAARSMLGFRAGTRRGEEAARCILVFRIVV